MSSFKSTFLAILLGVAYLLPVSSFAAGKELEPQEIQEILVRVRANIEELNSVQNSGVEPPHWEKCNRYGKMVAETVGRQGMAIAVGVPAMYLFAYALNQGNQFASQTAQRMGGGEFTQKCAQGLFSSISALAYSEGLRRSMRFFGDQVAEISQDGVQALIDFKRRKRAERVDAKGSVFLQNIIADLSLLQQNGDSIQKLAAEERREVFRVGAQAGSLSVMSIAIAPGDIPQVHEDHLKNLHGKVCPICRESLDLLQPDEFHGQATPSFSGGLAYKKCPIGRHVFHSKCIHDWDKVLDQGKLLKRCPICQKESLKIFSLGALWKKPVPETSVQE